MPTKRGPRRITFIPARFRNIPGIEKITTVRQLSKLAAYLDLPRRDRPPYTRLGASVPTAPNRLPDTKPTSTYAVCVDGRVSIVHREQDPRASERWMRNPARDWNLSHTYSR